MTLTGVRSSEWERIRYTIILTIVDPNVQMIINLIVIKTVHCQIFKLGINKNNTVRRRFQWCQIVESTRGAEIKMLKSIKGLILKKFSSDFILGQAWCIRKGKKLQVKSKLLNSLYVFIAWRLFCIYSREVAVFWFLCSYILELCGRILNWLNIKN